MSVKEEVGFLSFIPVATREKRSGGAINFSLIYCFSFLFF
jgi:hypothetical protein